MLLYAQVPRWYRQGDSLVDFWRYILGLKPSIVFLLPRQVWAVLLWKLKLLSAEKTKEVFLSFLNRFSGTQLTAAVARFWTDKGRRRIFPWVYEALEKDRAEGLCPICISASPDFLLSSILSSLGFEAWICTQFEHTAGRLNRMRGRNCKGEQKYRRLMRWQKQNSFDIDIHKVVSDSALDLAVFPETTTKYRIIRGKPFRVPLLVRTAAGYD